MNVNNTDEGHLHLSTISNLVWRGSPGSPKIPYAVVNMTQVLTNGPKRIGKVAQNWQWHTPAHLSMFQNWLAMFADEQPHATSSAMFHVPQAATERHFPSTAEGAEHTLWHNSYLHFAETAEHRPAEADYGFFHLSAFVGGALSFTARPFSIDDAPRLMPADYEDERFVYVEAQSPFFAGWSGRFAFEPTSERPFGTMSILEMLMTGNFTIPDSD